MTRTAAAGKQQQSEAILQQTGAGESGLHPAAQTGKSIAEAVSQTKSPDSLLDEALEKQRAESGFTLAPHPMQIQEGAVDKRIESGPTPASLPQTASDYDSNFHMAPQVVASQKDGNNRFGYVGTNLGVDSVSMDMMKVVQEKLKTEARAKRMSQDVSQEEVVEHIRGLATHIASEEPARAQKSPRGAIDGQDLDTDFIVDEFKASEKLRGGSGLPPASPAQGEAGSKATEAVFWLMPRGARLVEPRYLI